MAEPWEEFQAAKAPKKFAEPWEEFQPPKKEDVSAVAKPPAEVDETREMLPRGHHRAIYDIGKSLAETAKRAVEGATAYSSGLLSDEEKRQAIGQMAAGGTLGATSSVAHGASIGARAARALTDPAERAAGIGVDIPKGLAGRFPRIYEFLSRVPFVGTPAKEASRTAIGQIEQAGRRATEMPAGRGVIVEEGGDILRNTIAMGETEGRIFAGTGIPRMSKEGAIDTLINYSRSDNPLVREGLGRIRGAHTAKDWEVVQGSVLNRMGQAEGGAGFSMDAFAPAWKRLDEKAKHIMFPSSLSKHIDTIVDVESKYGEQLARSARDPMLRTRTVLGLGAAAAVLKPMTVLAASTGMGMRGITSAMAKPAVAASMANWTKTYDKLLNVPGPASMAAFQLATRNLANNLGEDVNANTILQYVKDNLPSIELQL